jgi:hypothetical protein
MSDSNIILNKGYRVFDSVNDLRTQFQTEWEEFLAEHVTTTLKNRIVINTAPNRVGKTITTLKVLNKMNVFGLEDWVEKYNPKILYLTDRHKQITEVKKTLQELDIKNFKQWYGLSHICARRYEKTTGFLIENRVTSGIICQGCYLKDHCGYKPQFKVKPGEIIGSPKEFLPTKHIQKKKWEYVILDEVIDKARKIKPTLPPLSEEDFENYNLTDDTYYLNYEIVKDLIKFYKNKKPSTSKASSWYTDPEEIKERTRNFKLCYEQLDFLENVGTELQGNALTKLQNQIRKDPNLINDTSIINLILFFNNLINTTEWLKYVSKHGYRTHFYKPYLHEVLDLIHKTYGNIILLNTSLETHIYEALTKDIDLNPKALEFSFNVVNKDSLLLHYNYHNRSCAKNALFEVDDNGRIMPNEKGIAETKGYGTDLIEMAKKILKFSNQKGLKTGLITYKPATKLFKDQTDVISYFGGHQGSNTFDDVDILIIVGTYNLPANVLYQKHYIIHNEFLQENPAKWNNYQQINGQRITLTDNEKLNSIKLYKLNEEHGQSIYRSGANVNKGKIVISFGYVPQGVENILSYRTFQTERGAKISISKWLKKTKTKKEGIKNTQFEK